MGSINKKRILTTPPISKLKIVEPDEEEIEEGNDVHMFEVSNDDDDDKNGSNSKNQIDFQRTSI
jgi:hypothetical protein